MAKKRDINAYRQVKDTMYKAPLSHTILRKKKNRDIDTELFSELKIFMLTGTSDDDVNKMIKKIKTLLK